MGVGRAARVATGTAGLLALFTACVDSPPAFAPEQVLRQATVVLLPPSCAGVLVGRGDEVLTAAHCVQGLGEALRIQTAGGSVLEGHVSQFDPEGDLAVVQLQRRARELPLAVAPEQPPPGAGLYFAGRADMGTDFQSVELRRLGRCPSLPQVSAALFTTLSGRPGESGAPVVDEWLRLVGLVHGGAACSIATPVAGSRIASLLEPHQLAPRLERPARQARRPAGESRPPGRLRPDPEVRAQRRAAPVPAIPPGPVCE